MANSSYKTRMLEAFRFRMYFYIVVVAITALLFFIQIINLQFVQGEEYKAKSRMNMENNIPIIASRGEIYDRTFKLDAKNVVLSSNRPSFNITITPANYTDKKVMNRTVRLLSKMLNVPYAEIAAELNTKNPWQRVLIKEDVPFETIVVIASHPDQFPHVNWEDAPVRVYNYNSVFAHLIGYIGSIAKPEYVLLKKSGYKYYQKIGKSGIEKQYDELLRGQDGYIRRIVDAHNRTEGEQAGKPPLAGNNLVLTVDYEIQKTAYEAMGTQQGAVIVIKPSTGEVLALLSKPDFDPNLIISKNNELFINDLNKDEKRPFLNRVIMSKYPPSSTFKIITSIAALEEERWKPEWTYFCSGKYVLKGYIDREFFCMHAHGLLDMYHALSESCNAYFYNVGYKIGPTPILKYASYFGYDERTGIDIPGEIPGFLPSKEWKRKTFGQGWFDGDTINMAIGQGFLAITPIELADLCSAIVNNGIVYKPHVVLEVRNPENTKVVKRFEREKIREIPLSASTLQVIKTGMRLMVQTGTGAQLSFLKVPVAGKTGSAQTRSKRQEDSSQHAWFVGFAPFGGTPEESVVVVVMVEYGMYGASTAVPVADKIFQKMISLGYFNAVQK